MRLNELICPKDYSILERQSDCSLVCQKGHAYPIVDGIPVLLRDDVNFTMDTMRASLARAHNDPNAIDSRNPEFHMESLGISESEKEILSKFASTASAIDPAVSVLIAATSGIAYKRIIGTEFDYPIPHLRLAPGNGKRLLDVGCNWGRWSIAAARMGYRVTGIDPSLGAIAAAKRVARKLGLEIDYICADARYMPFRSDSFDVVFSYSVIQHFSKTDAIATFEQIRRVLRSRGISVIQMPNYFGIRNLLHLCRRRFAEGSGFDVRYWRVAELRKSFERCIGPSGISVHCYFGLGLEPTDKYLMPIHIRAPRTMMFSAHRGSSSRPEHRFRA